ncbi:hypothetical protein BJX61DRAFT_495145 [Aspergillus egyptiacus]|nr:hypothetical protein BJX61DRAFT_495145 [Aspergillus egyptiacus]
MDFHAELGVANLDMPTQLNAPTGSSRETQTPGASTAPSYPRGYPELAAFMQSDAGFGILRRFNYLHLRKLLYMQEELTLLETQLHAVDNSELDDLNNMTRREDNNEERKMLMAEIQTKLLEYA